MQDIAIQRVRDQHAVFGNDMRVLRGAFGNHAFTRHPRVVRPLRNRLILHQRGIEQLRGFDIRPAPAQVRYGNDFDTGFGRWVVGERTALREGQ